MCEKETVCQIVGELSVVCIDLKQLGMKHQYGYYNRRRKIYRMMPMKHKGTKPQKDLAARMLEVSSEDPDSVRKPNSPTSEDLREVAIELVSG